MAPETFEVSIDTSQHALFCLLKAISGLDRPRENLKGLKQVLLPERALAVYGEPHFALLLSSELMEIVLTNVDTWQDHREQLLMALRHCEGNV